MGKNEKLTKIKLRVALKVFLLWSKLPNFKVNQDRQISSSMNSF